MGELFACMGSCVLCLGASVGISACVKMYLFRRTKQRELQQNFTGDCHTQNSSTQRKPRVLDVWVIHALTMVIASYLVVCAVIIYVFLLHPVFVLQAGIGGVVAIAIFWIGYTSATRGL